MAAKKKVSKKPKPVEVKQKQPPKKYYQILFNKDPELLTVEVERWIDKGWKVAGGANFSDKGYFQTMVKH